MRRHSVLRLLAAPVVAALLLAGCGSAASSSSSVKDSSSTGSGSGSSGGSTTNTSALSTGDVGSRFYNAFQKAGTLHFELQTAVAGQRSTWSGDADLGGSTVASSVTQKLPGGAGQVQALLVDGFFFLKSPQFGATWVKIDPKAKTGPGALVGQFGANSDPSRILEAMDSAATVTESGSEQVDGDDLVRKQVSALEVAGQSSTTTITYSEFGDPGSIWRLPVEPVSFPQ